MAAGSRRRPVFFSFGAYPLVFSSYDDDDEFSLPLLSRGSHASFDGSSKTPPEKYAPVTRGSLLGELFISRRVYNTFSAKIKALRHRKNVALPRKLRPITKS